MIKLLVFGTGSIYRRYKHLLSNSEIVAYLDNDKSKWGRKIDNVEIMPPYSVLDLQYDYVVIMSVSYCEMRKQLLELGVAENKILDKENRGVFSDLFIVESYIFSDGKERRAKVLVISHALDRTGAPIVTCRLAEILKRNGYDVTVMAEKNSNVSHQKLMDELLQKGISVILAAEYNDALIDYYQHEFDFFWVSTILLCDIVTKLVSGAKKVYWWLHEADDFYGNIDKTQIPNASNLYVLPVGWMAHNAFVKAAEREVYENLFYGIPDLGEREPQPHFEKNQGVVFGIAAAYSERKGIDFLYNIIVQNVGRWKGKVQFLFAGVFPKEVHKKFEGCSCIQCLGELDSEEMRKFYELIDVLICPSKFDPMPVVVTEAMQHKKMCIVSDMVGQSKLISHMQNGLMFKSENGEELTNCIDWVIDNKEKITMMSDKAYSIYESNFSMKIFEKNILQILEETQ